MRLRLAVRVIAVMLLLCLTAPLSRNQEYDRRDGDWWRGINAVSKAYYLAGFVDGMDLGNRFSVWGIDAGDKDGKNVSARLKTSYSDYRSKYLSSVTHIQLMEGLNTFYADSRNHRILVYDAVWLVLNQIAGKPGAEMQSLIEDYRKNADMER
jgi:hypothetical protein